MTKLKLILLVILLTVITACSESETLGNSNEDDLKENEVENNENEPDNNDIESSAVEDDDLDKEPSYEPVTITNFNRTFTVEEVPQRAVSLNLQTTEMMLALGLSEHMIATSYGNDEILPEFKEEYDKLPELAELWPSLEVLLDVEPDFVYGRAGAFGESDFAIASAEELEGYGISVYVDTDSYQDGTTLEDVYNDILNVGKIFHVEERAQDLVDSMKEVIASVQETYDISNLENPTRVLVYDMGGEDVFTAGGYSLQTHLIEKAGGENVFADIPNTWARVNWEEVLERDPEVIIINNYGDQSAEEKIEEIKQNPLMQNVKAVQDERFFIVRLTSVFASVKNAEVVKDMAEYFHLE